MDIDTKLMFATPVWLTTLPNYKMLNRKLMMDTVEHPLGGEWELFNLPGEGIAEFKELVEQAGYKAAKEYGIKFEKLEVRGRQHVRRPFENDPPHHHPLAEGIVGVYYLKASENAGDILLHDARGSVTDLWQDPYVKENIEKNRTNFSGLTIYRVNPEAGKLLLFPSYLVHSVETNLSNELRISLIVEYRFI